MKKLLLFFSLLVFGNAAFADKAPDVLNPEAVSQYTDMSIYFLSQLFGTVGNVLVGGEAQMMGKLFYQLNWGIFLITSIVIFYAVGMGTLKLASEGVTMQPGKSALFSLAKIALGISMVIPSAATGYCVMQQIVMFVVVKGVGMADSIWSAGLDYLDKDNGSIWQYKGADSPTGLYQNLFDQRNRDALLNSDRLGAQIFQNAVCMVGSRYTGSSSNSGGGGGIAVDGLSRPYFNVQEIPGENVFNFPGLNDTSVASGRACGQVSWDVNGSCSKGSDTTECAITRAAVSKLIYALVPAAEQYYCFKNAGSEARCSSYDTVTNLNARLAPYLVQAILSYYPGVKSYADIKENAKLNTNTNFVAKAKTDGWIVAGRYYWDIMRIARTGENGKTILSEYTSPHFEGPNNRDINAAGNLKDIVLSARTDFAKVATSAEFAERSNTVAPPRSSSASNNTNNYGAMDFLKGKDANLIKGRAIAAIGGPMMPLNPGIGATFIMATVGINKIGGLFNDWKQYTYNPIVFLYKVGQECIQLTLLIWIVGGVLIAASVAAYSVCSASNPMGFASNALVEWVKPILMMIATMLWMAGFFLCYYVPLYPFMVFLFASFGWFISVIEAMVAAPLVALGLTHPDNHDMLGKSEQAIMLLLSVFIQPSLLVLGLIGGIILSFVSFELLIYTFSAFIGDVMNSEGANFASTPDIVRAIQHSDLYTNSASIKGFNILVAPVLLIVFCVMTYTLLTQSFSLVYLLRDNVMKWLGAPSAGVPNVEQMLSDTRGAVSQVGSRTGEATSQGAGATQSSARWGEAIREDGKKAASGNVTGGAGG